MRAQLEWTRRAGYSESSWTRELFVFLGPDDNAETPGNWQRDFLTQLADAARSAYSQVTLVCGRPAHESAALAECARRMPARTLAMDALADGGSALEANAAAKVFAERRQRCPTMILLDDFWFPAADAAAYAADLLSAACPVLFVFAATVPELQTFVKLLHLRMTDAGAGGGATAAKLDAGGRHGHRRTAGEVDAGAALCFDYRLCPDELLQLPTGRNGAAATAAAVGTGAGTPAAVITSKGTLERRSPNTAPPTSSWAFSAAAAATANAATANAAAANAANAATATATANTVAATAAAASPDETAVSYEGRSFADVVARAQQDQDTADARDAFLVSDSTHRVPLRRPTELPIAQDRKQFAFLWSGDCVDAKQLVQYTLGDKLHASRECESPAKHLDRAAPVSYWGEEITRLLAERVDDEHIYSALRRRMAGADDGASRTFDRAGNRVQQILKVLPPRRTIKSMLDIGCAEGEITAALGTALQVPAQDVHGVDIRDVGNAEGFNFHRYDGERLPFANESIDCVVALMTLHHIREPKRVLAEAYRICARNGFLVIREHDCSTAKGDDVTVALDVVHGLYALAMTEPPEWPDFATEYYAFYRDREEWQTAATRVGWTLVNVTQTRGNMRYFYAVFRKVGSRMNAASAPAWGEKGRLPPKTSKEDASHRAWRRRDGPAEQEEPRAFNGRGAATKRDALDSPWTRHGSADVKTSWRSASDGGKSRTRSDAASTGK
eukprot:scaffold279_cov229-Pinguiococcus_pyrenoidosus.AAC.7